MATLPVDLTTSPFTRLPLELRLEIYALAFTSLPQTTTIGTSNYKPSHLTNWPLEPSLAHTNSWIRDEALPVYYATRDLTFNLQSHLGMDMVLAWIARCNETNPAVLRKLRYVNIIAGSGFYERPQEVRLDLAERRIVSARVQLPGHPNAAGQGPAFVVLRERLAAMPGRWDARFDMAEALKAVVGAFEVMLTDRTPEILPSKWLL